MATAPTPKISPLTTLPSWRQVVASRSIERLASWVEHPTVTHSLSNSLKRRLLFRALRIGWDEGAAWLIERTPLLGASSVQALELAWKGTLSVSVDALVQHRFSTAMVRWAAHHWRQPLLNTLLDRQKALGLSVWERGEEGHSCVSLGLVACCHRIDPIALDLFVKSPGAKIKTHEPRHLLMGKIVDKNKLKHQVLRAKWLKQMTELNPGNPEDWSQVLLTACRHGFLDCVDEAITRGANIHVRNHSGDNVLGLVARSFSAVRRNDLLIHLVSLGASIDAPLRTRDGMTSKESKETLRSRLEKSGDKGLLSLLDVIELKCRLTDSLATAQPVSRKRL